MAPAKVNLGLRIVGRRLDGYHLLESVFWPIDLCDELEISASESGWSAHWATDAPMAEGRIPSGEENLVVKAWKEVSPLAKDGIVLRKRIPMGAGLGGGSSDAGAVLRYLAGRQEKEPSEFLRVAEKLGADVPFFLSPSPTWVTGIGEKRQSLEVAPEVVTAVSFLIVLLPVHADTRHVFETYRKAGVPYSAPATQVPNVSNAAQLKNFLSTAGNDLEITAAGLWPVIGEVLRELRRQPCWYAGMTGSGSTCIGVFENDAACEQSAKDLASFFRAVECKGIKAKSFTQR